MKSRESRSFISSGLKFSIGITIVFLGSLYLSGCSVSEKKPPSKKEWPAPAWKKEEVNKQKEMTLKPVTLVFGPGLAKAFASAGVLKALEENKVPIKAIVGTGFGAIVGGLYVSSRSIHDFEWKLTRFKKKIFPGLSRKPELLNDPKSDFYRTLDSLLVGKQLQSLKTSFAMTSFTASDSSISYLQRGALLSAIKASSGIPKWVSVGRWGGQRAYSGALIAPYPVTWAQERWNAPVIVISVTDSRVNESSKPYPESLDFDAQMAMGQLLHQDALSKAALVIRPHLSGIGYFDFSKIHSIMFRGRKETLSKMNQIRQLLISAEKD